MFWTNEIKAQLLSQRMRNSLIKGEFYLVDSITVVCAEFTEQLYDI